MPSISLTSRSVPDEAIFLLTVPDVDIQSIYINSVHMVEEFDTFLWSRSGGYKRREEPSLYVLSGAYVIVAT